MSLALKFIAVALIPILAFSGCKKSKDTNNSASGGPTGAPTNVPNSSAGSLALSATLPAGSTADTAIAMNISGSQFANFADAKSEPIVGGALSISTPTASNAAPGAKLVDEASASKGTVLMTLKSSLDRFEAGASMKFVEVPAGADANLTKLPTDLLTDKTKADLGALGEVDGSYVANAVDASTLVSSENSGKLSELASTDNGIKLLRNAYMNESGDEAKRIRVNPQYMFRGDLRPFLVGTSFVPITIATASMNSLYHAYLLRFSGKHPDIKMSDLCTKFGDSTTEAPNEMKLIPPIKDLGGTPQSPILTFNKDNTTVNWPTVSTLTTKGSFVRVIDDCYSDFDSDSGPYFTLRNQTGVGGTPGVNFTWGGGQGFRGAIPTGLWDLKFKKGAGADQLIARFDIGSAFPLNDESATAYPIIYMPSLKIGRGANDVLSSIEFKWNLWNPATSSYIEITDLSLAREIITEVSFHMGDYYHNGWNDKDESDVSQYLSHPTSGNTYSIDLSKFEKSWTIKNSIVVDHNDEQNPKADSIAISYRIYGVDYRFTLQPKDLIP